jgi:hypothetical protein
LAVLALGSGVEDLPPEVVAVLLTAVVVATAVATRRYALLPDREVGDGDLTDA